MEFSKKQIELPRRNVERKKVAKPEVRKSLNVSSKPGETLKDTTVHEESVLDPARKKIFIFLMIFVLFMSCYALIGDFPYLLKNLSSSNRGDVKFALFNISMCLIIISLTVFMLTYYYKNKKRDSIENFKHPDKQVNLWDLLKRQEAENITFEEVKENIRNMTPNQLKQLNFLVNFLIFFVSLLMAVIGNEGLGIFSFFVLIISKKKLKEEILGKDS